MNTVTILRVLACLAFLNGIATPFTFQMTGNETVAFLIATLGWLSFIALIFLFPAIALLSGKINSESSKTYRAIEPIRFWVGLVTFEALTVFFAVLATMLFHSYLITARI